MDPSEHIDQLIAATADWRGTTLGAVRKAILEADPAIIEEWKWRGSPVWSRYGILAVANPHKAKVKLTFSHGASLPDPDCLFNAGLEGKVWRAIDFLEGDEVNGPALKKLVRAAVDFNQAKSTKKIPAAKGKAAQGGEAAPVLLSGGNPQIVKGDGAAPVQAYIDAMPGWKGDLGKRLDALITRTLPDARRAVKWNSPLYGMERKGWFLGVHAFTHYVKLTFFRGAALDPLPPGVSKSPDVRYLDIREGDELDEAQLADWLRQAAALPGFLAP